MSSAPGGAASARETPPSEMEMMTRPEGRPGSADDPQTLAAPSQGAPHPTVDAMAGSSAREVARRAYELYLARGGAHGFDMEDWIQAESELRAAPPADPAR